MAELKVKSEFIGATTSVPGIGRIKIREDHAGILAQAGRWELLDGERPNVKKLVPVMKETEPVKEVIEPIETPIKNKKKPKRNASTD